MSMLHQRNDVFDHNEDRLPNNITVHPPLCRHSGGLHTPHTHGSNVYWAVFSVMAFTAVAFSIWAYFIPRGQRIFHYITIALLATASVAYFTMASNLGSVHINVQYPFIHHSGVTNGRTRQIFYVRYVDWVITTPLLLLDILLISGLPWSNILWIIFLDEVMIVTGLIGALVKSSYKWGYYTFANVAFLLVVYEIVWVGRRNARILGEDVHKLYIGISVFTMVIWTLYPIAWGVSEGANIIASDSEAVFYGILDVLAKPVFGIWILWGHRRFGLNRFGIANPRYTAGLPIMDKDRGTELPEQNAQRHAGNQTQKMTGDASGSSRTGSRGTDGTYHMNGAGSNPDDNYELNHMDEATGGVVQSGVGANQ
ncbi:hypothetical protein EDC01DRAFT_716444 [Geopyxis carbonaria]|nr:hypothetical protein EDC01DRAFT_716444 [Geopyxis carbonaria]